jgi:hypothetical protein
MLCEKAGFEPKTLGTKAERYDHCPTRPVKLSSSSLVRKLRGGFLVCWSRAGHDGVARSRSLPVTAGHAQSRRCGLGVTARASGQGLFHSPRQNEPPRV